MNRRISLLAALTLLSPLTVTAPHAMETGPLRIPADQPPAVLADLGDLAGSLDLAISYDGRAAAVAFAHPSKPKRSLVRMARAGEAPPGEWEVRGIVRSLRFGPEGEQLFGVVSLPSRRSESYLMRIDPGSRGYERLISLPSTAADLDVWTRSGSLLVACKEEIRSVLLPAGRSGPLYWVRGGNLAIASVPGGDRVLVGQSEEILLVDLSDTHDEDRMPVRDRVSIPGPVHSLAAAPDGSAVLARLTDGKTFRVTFGPLALEEQGESDAVAWLGRPIAPPPEPEPVDIPSAAVTAPPSTPEPEPIAPASEPAAEPPLPTRAPESAPEPAPAVVAEPEDAEPPVSPEEAPVATVEETPPTEPAAEPEVPSTVKELEEAPAPEPEPEPSAVEPEEPAVRGEPVSTPDPSRGAVYGAVEGPAAARVVAVVLLGPNNILREAARVAPRPDGAWQAGGLDPGTYRIVLDGGGNAVLATDPPFRVVEVTAGTRKRVPAIRVLRAM